MPRGRERRSKRSASASAKERRAGERRQGARIPIEMWVEESVGRELYFTRAANLSEGGLFLERTVPHPTGTVVTLRFTLPGETEALQIKGLIANSGDDEEDLGMGVRFVGLDAPTKGRIRTFVERGSRTKSK